MKRQFVVFWLTLLLIAAVSLVLNARTIVDLIIFYPTTVDLIGTKIILGPDNTVSLSDKTEKRYLLEAQRVVAERLQQLTQMEAHDVVLYEEGYLAVELPPGDNLPNIIRVITQVGEVEFIDGGTISPPLGQNVRTGATTIPERQLYQTLFTRHEILSIVPPDADAGQIFYQITPVSNAAERFGRFLSAQRDGYVCLVVDHQVINCSDMYYWSGERLDILPNLSNETDLSLADLAILLESGPLPISLDVVIN